MFQKRKGVVFSLHFVLLSIILLILIGATTIIRIQDIVDSWQLKICRIQATTLDNRLSEYSKSHLGFKWANIKEWNGKTIEYSDDSPSKHFQTRPQYPFSINDKSEITAWIGSDKYTSLTGYFGREFHFSTESEKTPYEFIYIPLDEDGNKVTLENNTSVAFYDLLYYDREGNVYASPKSYRNLNDNVKKIIKGE